MRRRQVIAALLASALAFAPGAHAADPAPQVTDPESDANFLNDNAPISSPLIPENPANNNPTPVGSEPAADILSILWKSTIVKGTLRGFTVTMTLKGEPKKSGILFRATSETADCTQLWFQYYTSDPKNTPQAGLRHNCGVPVEVVPIPVQVVGNSIIWTFEYSDKNLPGSFLKKGAEIIRMGGHARPFVTNPTCVDATRCTTNPVQYDTTNNVPGPYKVGS